MNQYKCFAKEGRYICILFFFLLILPLILLPSNESELQPIPNFFTIQVETAIANEFSQALDRFQIENFNPYNQTFSFNDYGQYKTLALSELNNRFYTQDIRFDPYMKSLQRFFYQEEGKVTFYLNADLPSVLLALKILFAFASLSGWSIVGFSILKFVILFIFTIVLFYILFKKNSQMRYLLIFFFILNFALVINGSLYLWIWGIFLSFLSFLFFQKESIPLRRKFRYGYQFDKADFSRYKILFLVAIILPLLFLPIVSLSFISILSILLIILSAFLINFIYVAYLYNQEKKPGYSGFLMHPFLKQISIDKKIRLYRFLFVIVLLLLPILLLSNISLNNSSLSLEKVATINKIDKINLNNNHYPNYISYQKHHLYQQQYPYGITWNEISDITQEKFDIHQYELKNKKISLFNETIVLYSNESMARSFSEIIFEKTFLGNSTNIRLYGNNSLSQKTLIIRYLFVFAVILFPTLFAFVFILSYNKVTHGNKNHFIFIKE